MGPAPSYLRLNLRGFFFFAFWMYASEPGHCLIKEKLRELIINFILKKKKKLQIKLDDYLLYHTSEFIQVPFCMTYDIYDWNRFYFERVEKLLSH